MKSTVFSLLVFLVCTASLVNAHEKKTAGPNGGRLLTVVEPHAEFFVTAERKVQITFVDDNLQPIAPTAQTVIVTAGNRSAPTTLNFARRGNVLLSEGTLPAGNDFPTVVQIKTTPEAKTTVARFNLNTIVCSECQNAEYACICDH
jgi:hypothetical protein